MRKAREGDTVRVHITGSLDDGTEFATTEGEVPMELTIGEGMRISALQQSALGMAAGEKKTVRLESNQAFGEKRPELIWQIPRSTIPDNIDLTVGTQVRVSSKGGDPVQVTVTNISYEQVTIDANPPFAGQALTFDIELVEIV
ncbi:MAG: FKBP-type peptidyl-prolyl cis-trans isomerase [Thermodesulfobacteriota bacterium]|nr:FKBP-type peptidyl-prolyl cis-trans isomerase [Thermodesulfobacteriota bacterium]